MSGFDEHIILMQFSQQPSEAGDNILQFKDWETRAKALAGLPRVTG